MKKIVLLALMLCMLAPLTALAQEELVCDDAELDALLTCLETDSLTNCLAANPDCTQDDLNTEISGDTLEEHILELCCARGSQGGKVGCLRRGIATYRSARRFIPADIRADVIEGLREAIAAVRETGECPVDDEGDGGDV